MENKMFFILPVVAYTKIETKKMLVIGWFNKTLIIRFLMK